MMAGVPTDSVLHDIAPCQLLTACTMSAAVMGPSCAPQQEVSRSWLPLSIRIWRTGESGETGQAWEVGRWQVGLRGPMRRDRCVVQHGTCGFSVLSQPTTPM